MRLSGITAVVTGAAGGIGASLARLLHARRARLVLVDWDEDKLAAVAQPLGAAWRKVDVSKREQLEELAAWVEREHGGAQLLINNAGVTVVGSFEDHSVSDWERVIGVNLMGVIYGCRAFLPQLRRAEQAWIVNLSSMFGLLGVPGQTAYCASKFGVRGFSEALAGELQDTRVGLTVVHPGGVATGIVANANVAGGGPDPQGAMKRAVRFFERHTMPPDRAAELILGAVEGEVYRLRVTKEAYVFDWFTRVAPVLGRQVAVRAITRAMGLGDVRKQLTTGH